MKRTKTVIYVGGGSGGHISPLLAVHKELIKLTPKPNSLNFVFITNRQALGMAKQLFRGQPQVHFKTITAGKFRRHPALKFSQRLKLTGYYLKNISDVFKTLLGFWQSFWLMIKLKPSLIISKGGYVAVPVIFMAKLIGAKIIIHDSDARPGLASKLTAPKADKIFTGFETDFYPKNKTEWVGIPINELNFSADEIIKFKSEGHLKLNPKLKTILVSGGGNGSGNLNEIINLNLKSLLKKYNVIHQAGEGKIVNFDSSKYPGEYIQFGFCPQVEMLKYLKLSDLAISRAGATSIQELAYNKKPSIIIPSPYLSDQIKNIKFLKARGATLSLDELKLGDDPSLLMPEIEKAMTELKTLSQNIAKIYKPGAAKKMAEVVVSLL
jgi:UDP-N-acetylglucosamine--N-acetylmuramyl-(pentapeptide) pyrophosphoryl-undecaprenol N-acetylglucosamine transferase